MQSIFVAIRVVLRILKNGMHRLFGQSDRQRWSDELKLEHWWVERTERLASLVPAHGRVIEFGAGRRQLENFLHPTCSYLPSDMVDRGAGTFICDLNRRPLPSLKPLRVDTAVFGGVLEYVHDIESLVAWLSDHVDVCIASYTCVLASPGLISRLRDQLARRYYGYMNGFSEESLVAIFLREGFRCEAQDTWTSQELFRFRRVERQSHDNVGSLTE